jgi:hypothetical protein
MIAAEDERKLLKVADQVSELIVAAPNEGGGGSRGSLKEMISHAGRLVDGKGSGGRVEMSSFLFAFLQGLEASWE